MEYQRIEKCNQKYTSWNLIGYTLFCASFYYFSSNPKLMKKNILWISIVAFLCSCTSFHSGTLSSSISDRNVCYVDVASGISKTKKILWFGGIRKDALVLEAKKQMILNRPLKAGEQYQNITVDFKQTWYGIWVQNTRATVHADVVRFCSEDSNPMDSSYLKMLTPKKSNPPKAKLASDSEINTQVINAPDYLNIGDTVCYYNGFVAIEPCIVVSMDANTATIRYYNSKNIVENKVVKYPALYRLSGALNGVRIGDNYEYSRIESGEVKKKKGIVKGLGLKQFYIFDETGSRQLFFYKK